ncbi:hypothetical protein GWI33_005250 [Rhynchophorus ferrugineus]|uniref:protein-histidine N-methyltransferase n=1 Tax=Rhynchophorus ferrugineus TaxID=354439 RepID=A0A834ILV3_RHYFE|nr:hypothetical protein GWI33_005250 [Rhynchophorus ferrugineus]
MGRKSGQSKNANRKNKAPKEEKELLETVDSLLRLTTLPLHNNLTQSLDCQKKISSLIERIRLLEDKLSKKSGRASTNNNSTERSRIDPETVKNFTKWIQENGGELQGCSISSFAGYDVGLRVEQEIPQSSLVIAVPRKVMMSVETASNSILKDIVNKVEILKNMPNVLLAVYLLVEKFTPNSFWKPYLDILPKSYNTVLYYSYSELEELKGSPTLEVALRQIKSIVRQYAYFHKLFWNSDDTISELMKDKFSFAEYW